MPVEVILPKVDMDMTHGTLAVWHVDEGAQVQKGAPLFDIETDKAAMEVESPASGRIHARAARPGDKIAVGTVVALIYAEGEALPAADVPPAKTPALSMNANDGPGPVEVILPKVDMDMTHGTVAVWHVAEGDPVTKGAALFDIETDKAAMEVESPASGNVHFITAPPGRRVAVGSVVAHIFPAGMAVVRPAAAPAPAASPEPAALAPVALTPAPVAPAEAALRATPAARAAARAQGIALADVPGTGPLGRIQRQDVTGRARTEAPDTPVAVPAVAAPVDWTPQTGPLHISHRKGTGIPLVMLHGFTADSQSWAPLEKALGPDRPLIRLDLPGHGRSPRRGLRSFAELARMMVEAFDAATAQHDTVHLMGHSLGGALAIAIADIRASRVASLTLIAPAGLGPEIDAATLTGITRATRAESLAPWLRRLTATPEAISDDYAGAAMKLRADPALRAAQTAMADVLFPDGVQPFDLRPALARLDIATAVLWGRQDHILPFRHALAVHAEFAIHLLAGAGHVPQIECPDRVARILARHLAAAEALT